MLLVSVPSTASSSQEADFVSRINAERASRGLSTLVVKSDLTAVARDWSGHMAAAGAISHDPNLGGKISGWTMLGDNVGKGPSVSAIHQAFMDSDTHRHIILDTDFNQVGVGVVKSGDVIYVTEIFARRVNASVPSHAPKPKTKPAPVAPVADIVALTGRIWAVDLTAPPVTVDVLMQLIQLDA
jgi:cysteine-rich secretory family protein